MLLRWKTVLNALGRIKITAEQTKITFLRRSVGTRKAGLLSEYKNEK